MRGGSSGVEGLFYWGHLEAWDREEVVRELV